MCRDELSRAHSALVSSAIRLAECMGLHRDPTQYGLSPIEVHVRRLLWYQLCFLDIRTCEVHGPRPTLRRDEFDTQMPLNIDDADLVATGDPKEQDVFTDMTVMRVRFETNEMLRVLWNDRLRLERKAITLTHILGKVEAFRKAFNERYMPMLDDSVPLQRFTKILMQLFMTRMHIMLLHRYHSTMGNDVPDRLRQLLLGSGTECLECAVELETAPDLNKWAWYSGAFQQYHTAILLLMEVYAFPNRKEGDRIWRCLDYIFDAEPHQPRHLKGRKLLSEMRDKFGVYRDMRKMRAPVTLKQQPVEGSLSIKASLKKEPSSQDNTSPPPKSKGRTPVPTTHIPLNFDMVNWQPVRPMTLEQQERSSSGQSSSSIPSASPRSPPSATVPKGQRSANWGFDSAQTFISEKKVPKSPNRRREDVSAWGQHPANAGRHPPGPVPAGGYPTPPSATSSTGNPFANEHQQPQPQPPPPPQQQQQQRMMQPPGHPASARMAGYGQQQPSPALVSQLSQEPSPYFVVPQQGPGTIDEMMNDIDWVSPKTFSPTLKPCLLDVSC